MLKLIRLEWRKGNIRKYIRCVSIMTILLLIFLIATAGTAGADTTSLGFYEKSIINAAVELYANMVYIVFAGFMLSSFIVAEYEKGTIGLTFSYPIKRRKIFLSKILSVWFFNVVTLVFSKIFIYSALLVLKSFIQISDQDIPVNSLMFWVDMFLSSLIMISISCLALPIGLKIKSSKVTVVTAVFIAFFSHINIGGQTILGKVSYYIFLVVLAVLFIFLSIQNIETDDVS